MKIMLYCMVMEVLFLTLLELELAGDQPQNKRGRSSKSSQSGPTQATAENNERRCMQLQRRIEELEEELATVKAERDLWKGVAKGSSSPSVTKQSTSSNRFFKDSASSEAPSSLSTHSQPTSDFDVSGVSLEDINILLSAAEATSTAGDVDEEEAGGMLGLTSPPSFPPPSKRSAAWASGRVNTQMKSNLGHRAELLR